LFIDFRTTRVVVVFPPLSDSSFSSPKNTDPNAPSPILTPFFTLVKDMSILGAFNSSWSTEPSWKAWTLSEHFDDDFPDGEDFEAKEQDAKKEELCLADKYTDDF